MNNVLPTINPLWSMAAMAAFVMLPLLVASGTSYLKVSVVFGFLRGALGGGQVPGGMTVAALSLITAIMTMTPVLQASLERLDSIDFHRLAQDPTEIVGALGAVSQPYRDFLERMGESSDRELLGRACDGVERAPVDRTRFDILLMSFMLAELKRGCIIGLALLIPFLVIDVVVANILMGLGMVMVSPAVITLPLKLVLLTLGNGWVLLVEALVRSYG